MPIATTDYAFCTLDDVKKFMMGSRDVADDVEDSNIEEMIKGVSTGMESFMDRKIMSREDTEYYDGDGTKYLFVDRYPIITISGIWDDRSWSWAASSLITSTEYRIQNEKTIVMNNLVFLDDEQNVKITYTAGYATAPTDLKMACIEEVTRRFHKKRDITLSSKTLDDGTNVYIVDDFLPHNKTVMNRYRRRYAL